MELLNFLISLPDFVRQKLNLVLRLLVLVLFLLVHVNLGVLVILLLDDLLNSEELLKPVVLELKPRLLLLESYLELLHVIEFDVVILVFFLERPHLFCKVHNLLGFIFQLHHPVSELLPQLFGVFIIIFLFLLLVADLLGR